MNQIPVKAIVINPQNERLSTSMPNILIRLAANGLEFVDGRMRAGALADLGQVVPARNISTGEHVLLDRDRSGQWTITAQDDAEMTRLQDQMREARKWKASA